MICSGYFFLVLSTEKCLFPWSACDGSKQIISFDPRSSWRKAPVARNTLFVLGVVSLFYLKYNLLPVLLRHFSIGALIVSLRSNYNSTGCVTVRPVVHELRREPGFVRRVLPGATLSLCATPTTMSSFMLLTVKLTSAIALAHWVYHRLT